MDNQTASSADLTAEEMAYFESGGEAMPTEQSTPETQTNDEGQEGQQAPVEGVEEGQQEPAQRDDKGRFVPHQALHAEREEHKKTKAELERISREQAVLNDRWNTLLKLREQTEQPQQEDAPPDPEQDIFGYAKWQADQMRKLQERIDGSERQAQEQRQAAEQERAVWNDWHQSATAYAQQAPDFGDAVQYLSDLRSRQISALASVDERFANSANVHAQINAELRSLVVGARQKGQDPAAVVHELAKAYGFAPQKQSPQQQTMPEKLAKIASAQDQARTIGQASGGAGGDALTAEAIAAMSPKDFERWVADPKNARLLDKMMGA